MNCGKYHLCRRIKKEKRGVDNMVKHIEGSDCINRYLSVSGEHVNMEGV